MQYTIELIKKFFENMEWSYNFEDGDTFGLELETKSAIGLIQYAVVVKETEFVAYAFIPNKPEPEMLPRVTEFLLRANIFIPYCSFHLDYNEREISVRSWVDFELCKLSYAVVERALTTPLLMIDAFGKSLLRAMYSNDDIEQLIMEADDSFWND